MELFVAECVRRDLFVKIKVITQATDKITNIFVTATNTQAPVGNTLRKVAGTQQGHIPILYITYSYIYIYIYIHVCIN